METFATSKGQIVIPAPIRRRYNIKAGTKIEVVDAGEHILLRPITAEYIHSLRGSLKGSGALKVIEEERRLEREI